MNLVFFDFDGTLTKKDTLWPLAIFYAQKTRKWLALFYFFFILILFKLRLVKNDLIKRAFLQFFIRGKTLEQVESVGREFVNQKLQPLLNQNVLMRFQGHLKNGDWVFIVSSNFDFLVKLLQEKWGFCGMIATVSENKDGRYTGRIAGKVVRGGEKLTQLKRRFSLKEIETAIAYGDEESDRFILEAVGKGIKVG